MCCYVFLCFVCDVLCDVVGIVFVFVCACSVMCLRGLIDLLCDLFFPCGSSFACVCLCLCLRCLAVVCGLLCDDV